MSQKRDYTKGGDPVGQPFDPNGHEAMSMVESPGMELGSTSAVVQKGFKPNDQVIWTAMLMVTKASGGKVSKTDLPGGSW